tara:strand:- start:180 stop:440 length:261 start_codon:yes stop_codon:yes gene_type:complete
MNYVYRMSMNGTIVFYKRIEDATGYIKAVAKSESTGLHISIERVDARCVQWEELDYKLQSVYGYSSKKWIEGGCPAELVEEGLEAK